MPGFVRQHERGIIRNARRLLHVMRDDDDRVTVG